VDPGPAGGSGTPCPSPQQRYYAELFPGSGEGSSTVSLAQTTIDAPAIVHPGDRLRFVVHLVNQPQQGLHGAPPPLGPITFNPCPTYHEELEGVAGTYHVYELNCRET